MRYLLALILTLACGCIPPTPIIYSPTNVFIARRDENGFGACEVVINRTWEEHFNACGPPVRSMPWTGHPNGQCHIYETNTVVLATGNATPFVAVCAMMVREDAPKRDGDVEKRKPGPMTNRVVYVLGLRTLPQ